MGKIKETQILTSGVNGGLINNNGLITAFDDLKENQTGKIEGNLKGTPEGNYHPRLKKRAVPRESVQGLWIKALKQELSRGVNVQGVM